MRAMSALPPIVDASRRGRVRPMPPASRDAAAVIGSPGRTIARPCLHLHDDVLHAVACRLTSCLGLLGREFAVGCHVVFGQVACQLAIRLGQVGGDVGAQLLARIGQLVAADLLRLDRLQRGRAGGRDAFPAEEGHRGQPFDLGVGELRRDSIELVRHRFVAGQRPVVAPLQGAGDPADECVRTRAAGYRECRPEGRSARTAGGPGPLPPRARHSSASRRRR